MSGGGGGGAAQRPAVVQLQAAEATFTPRNVRPGQNQRFSLSRWDDALSRSTLNRQKVLRTSFKQRSRDDISLKESFLPNKRLLLHSLPASLNFECRPSLPLKRL